MSEAKVCIIGPGAMGAFYYWKFKQAGFDDVAFLAAGERAERLEQQGVVVNGRTVPARVVRPGEPDGAADLVLVAVKYHHLGQVVRDMEHLVAEDTLIVSVMNGIDSEEILAREFGWDKVLYAIALGIDAQRDDNRIRVTNEGSIYFGEAVNTKISPRVARVRSIFDQAGIGYEIPEDMIRVLWWKYMINVGVNQTSAVMRAPFGVFQRVDEARELMQDAMREVIQVASAKGVHLSSQDIQAWLEVLDGLDPNGRTSMCQDVMAGRKTEVEMFAGALQDMGRSLGVPTPVNEVLFKCLRSIEHTY